jgi:hypothetical protein
MNPPMPKLRERLICVTAALIATLACGCGTTAPSETFYTQAARTSAARADDQTAQQAPKGNDLLGVWEGTTFARRSSERGRVGAQQLVTITLIEGKNSAVTGYYKCAYSNQNCLGQNTTGKVVVASLKDSSILVRVMLPDATSSMFRGHVANSSVIGGYSVYGGGGLLEQGDWRAQRSY